MFQSQRRQTTAARFKSNNMQAFAFILLNALILIAHGKLSMVLSSNMKSAGIDWKDSVAITRSMQRYCKEGDYIMCSQLALGVIEQGNVKSTIPSAYFFLGFSQYSTNDLEGATQTFLRAVKVHDNDLKSWMALGESYLHRFRMKEAIWAYEAAIIDRNLTQNRIKLFRGRVWLADWKDYNANIFSVRHWIYDCIRKGLPVDINPSDFTGVTAEAQMKMAIEKHGGSRVPAITRPVHVHSEKLKIGLISSDYGIHPVSMLIRGLVEMMDRTKFEVYCFAIVEQESYWYWDISGNADRFLSLAGMSTKSAAEYVASFGIDMMIDLNGHTLNSGLRILEYRPAPLQFSFLGFPMTTAHECIDIFVSDKIVSPPNFENHFTEKLAYMPSTYMVTDHLQILGRVLSRPRPTRGEAGFGTLLGDTIIYACFSNWQKMDPDVFANWVQILRAVPNSVLWFMKYKGHEQARENLIAMANSMGINGAKRFIFKAMMPFIDHLWVKQVADVVLDTNIKNGHTTITDVLWSGVPFVTMEGSIMSSRVASSLAKSIGLPEMITYSQKEYTDLAIKLGKNRFLRTHWRRVLRKNTLRKPVFNTAQWTKNFETMLQSSWENFKGNLSGHLYASHLNRNVHDEDLVPNQMTSKDGDVLSVQSLIKRQIKNDIPILLNIGGKHKEEGWWNVDITPGEHVTIVNNMQNLSMFPNNSVVAIYGSHVLEHVSYLYKAEVLETLKEWHRILKPGGLLFTSVPDIGILSKLFLESINFEEKFMIMRMMFGGQTDQHDQHKVGFDTDILVSYLHAAGYCNMTQVDNFGLFDDTSTMRYKGVPISLNVQSSVCKEGLEHIHPVLKPKV